METTTMSKTEIGPALFGREHGARSRKLAEASAWLGGATCKAITGFMLSRALVALLKDGRKVSLIY